MLDVRGVDHIGIRIRDKDVTVPFYALLGFQVVDDTGFERGHPIPRAVKENSGPNRRFEVGSPSRETRGM